PLARGHAPLLGVAARSRTAHRERSPFSSAGSCLGGAQMKREELSFERPKELFAAVPPELRAGGRDDVRLLVSGPSGHEHARFVDLPQFLRRGDLLVVNDSATIPASLRAEGRLGQFLLNLSTKFGEQLWLAEPRWDAARKGPLPIEPGEEAVAEGARIHFVAPCPGIPRLWFIRPDRPLT